MICCGPEHALSYACSSVGTKKGIPVWEEGAIPVLFVCFVLFLSSLVLLLSALYIMWSQCRHATVARHFCMIENNFNFNGCFKVILLLLFVCVGGGGGTCICVCVCVHICICVCVCMRACVFQLNLLQQNDQK